MASRLAWLSPACSAPPGAVQPSVVIAPGLAAAGPAPAAQLGGTDKPPAEAAWPRPPNIGIPPKPAEPAGATAPVGTVPSKPSATPAALPAMSPPSLAAGRIPPCAISSRSDVAEPKFPDPMLKRLARLPPGGSAAAALAAELRRPDIPPDKGEPVATELVDSVAAYEPALAPKV
jgi:hypothetical protein